MSRARFARRLSAVCCALLLLATAAGPVSAAAGARAGDRPVVDTDRGPVRGTAHGTYRTFEGIPYAAPPTGPLRWRLPQPAARWTGVRDAGAPGARCMQLPPIGPGGPGGSEDCLYLNVTAPTGPTAATDAGRGRQRRPVMVWFHGGGFANGAGDLYRPQRLAVQGDAVVVTVNYRLGIFGLFGHPALGGAPDFRHRRPTGGTALGTVQRRALRRQPLRRDTVRRVRGRAQRLRAPDLTGLGRPVPAGDPAFICPALRDGRALARHVPVHAYRFSDRDAPNFTGLPEVEGLPYGASHGFELPYLFTMDAALTGPQRALSERMTGYWTAFARTGRPPAAWPPLGSAGSVLSFAPGSDGTRVVDGAAEHHCAFWDAQWP